MDGTINISLPQVQIFLLIFLRVSAIMLMVPIFDNKSIPLLFKAGLIFSISIILFPVVNINENIFTYKPVYFAIGVASEIMIGAIIGLSVKLLFAGIQLAGQLNGIQMGLSMSSTLDPTINANITTVSQFINMFALLIFLITNAHHLILRALVESFAIIPPFDFQLNKQLMEIIINLGGNMFVIGVKVAAPLMAVLLLVSVAFALTARTAPQMNIMFVAMPVKIFVGLLFLGFFLPLFDTIFQQLFSGLGKEFMLLLKHM